VKDSATNASFNYNGPVPITSTGVYGAALSDSSHRIRSNWVWQQFNLNKATGKPVQLASAPNASYKGMGSFTLVDGIQNTRCMVKSFQFLGFLGKDLDAVIDLGETMSFNKIGLHVFEQPPSWIYKPRSVSFSVSRDGIQYTQPITLTVGTGIKNLLYEVSQPFEARYVKIVAINFGTIPPGQPGAGTRAWLFADEIEIQ
jgi:hexosaminidase